MIHIKTATSQPHSIEDKASEVKSQAHGGLSSDKGAARLKLLRNTVAPRRQHLTSANPQLSEGELVSMRTSTSAFSDLF